MKLRSFGAQVIYGLIVGLVLGLVARNLGEGSWLAVGVDEVGSAYVSLLKLLVPPLVVTAVVTSIANLRQVTNAARLAWQTLLWFAITALASVSAGIVVGLIITLEWARVSTPRRPRHPPPSARGGPSCRDWFRTTFWA